MISILCFVVGIMFELIASNHITQGKYPFHISFEVFIYSNEAFLI